MKCRTDLTDHAGDLAEVYALSGFGAVNLASALLVGTDTLIVATWDARLAAITNALGVAMPRTSGERRAFYM